MSKHRTLCRTRIYRRMIISILVVLALGSLSGCGEKTYIDKDTPGYSFTNVDEATTSDGKQD